MAVFSALMLSACVKSEKNEGQNIPTNEQKVGELECTVWELHEEVRKLEDERKELNRKNALIQMRIDALLQTKKSWGDTSSSTREYQPGDLWSEDPEIFRKAYKAEFYPDGTPKFDPKYGWEIIKEEEK